MEKSKKFKHLQHIIGRYQVQPTPKGKATAELDASKNPMKYMKSDNYLKYKGLKGVAF